MGLQYTVPIPGLNVSLKYDPSVPQAVDWPKVMANIETPYVAPDLHAGIEQEYADPVAANYARLGIPYNGDPAADNAQRLAANNDLFASDEDLVINDDSGAYVAPSLNAAIARDYARRAQPAAATGGYAGAGGGPCDAGACGEEAYVPPQMF